MVRVFTQRRSAGGRVRGAGGFLGHLSGEEQQRELRRLAQVQDAVHLQRRQLASSDSALATATGAPPESSTALDAVSSLLSATPTAIPGFPQFDPAHPNYGISDFLMQPRQCPNTSSWNDCYYAGIPKKDGKLQWTCPAGSYCLTPENKDPCTPGFLCPENSQQPVFCPPRYYCSNDTATFERCPEGHFCPTGTTKPLDCGVANRCPEGSYSVPRLFVLAIFVAVVVTIVFLFAAQRRGEKMRRLRHARNLQQQSNMAAAGGAPVSSPDAAVAASGLGDASDLVPDEVTESALAEEAEEATAAAASPTVKEGAGKPRGLLPPCTQAFNLRFENLGYSLPSGLELLRRVSGEIQAGRTCAVMGPSGAGKTTFVSVLMGKLRRSSGEVYVNGERAKLRHLRKLIGFVPQDDVMLRELTVRELLMHSAQLRLPAKLSESERQQIVMETMAFLGLTNVGDSVIGDEHRRGISGGQRKRVNIGLELVADPSIIVLDEPTSGLDSSTATDICRLLRAAARQKRITVLSIIHSPPPLAFAQFDDLILLGKGGVLVYAGPRARVVEFFGRCGFYRCDGEGVADFLLELVMGRVPCAIDRELAVPNDLAALWETYGRAFLASPPSVVEPPLRDPPPEPYASPPLTATTGTCSFSDPQRHLVSSEATLNSASFPVPVAAVAPAERFESGVSSADEVLSIEAAEAERLREMARPGVSFESGVGSAASTNCGPGRRSSCETPAETLDGRQTSHVDSIRQEPTTPARDPPAWRLERETDRLVESNSPGTHLRTASDAVGSPGRAILPQNLEMAELRHRFPSPDRLGGDAALEPAGALLTVPSPRPQSLASGTDGEFAPTPLTPAPPGELSSATASRAASPYGGEAYVLPRRMYTAALMARGRPHVRLRQHWWQFWRPKTPGEPPLPPPTPAPTPAPTPGGPSRQPSRPAMGGRPSLSANLSALRPSFAALARPIAQRHPRKGFSKVWNGAKDLVHDFFAWVLDVGREMVGTSRNVWRALRGEHDPIRQTPGVLWVFWRCLQRAALQQLRSQQQIILGCLTQMGSGIFISIATQNFTYLGAQPSALCNTAPYNLQYACRYPTDNVREAGMFFSLGALFSAMSTATVTFGVERVVFWRDTAAGMPTLPYFIAKVFADFPRMVLGAFLYSLGFTVFYPYRSSYEYLFVIALCLFFAAFGMGYFVSMVTRRENMALVCTAFALAWALVFSGVIPDLGDVVVPGSSFYSIAFMWYISAPRWAIEALWIKEVGARPFIEIFNQPPLHVGYAWDAFVPCLMSVFYVGLGWLGASFLGLKLLRRSKCK